MPRKSRGKFKSCYRSTFNCDGAEVFRNPSVVLDGTDPKMSLKYIQDIFHGNIDDDVIAMVFSECAYDVDQAVETLTKLIAEDSTNQSEGSIGEVDQRKFDVLQWPPSGDSFTKYIGEVGCVEAFPIPENDDSLGAQKMEPPLGPTNIPAPWFPQQQDIAYYYPNQNTHQYSYQYGHFSDPVYNTRNTLNINTSSQQFLSSQYYKNSIPDFVSPFSATAYKYASPVKTCSNLAFPQRQKTYPAKKVEETKKKDNVLKSAFAKIKSGTSILIILRGLPGSGKSTLALKLKHSGVILSTDDFFLKNGKYMYDWTKLEQAHFWNKRRTEQALIDLISPIIIDNTNTEVWEMTPYVAMGRKYKYEILILEPNTPWKFKPKELSLRNKHGVPKEKIVQMLSKYQHNVTVNSIMKYLDKFDPRVTNTDSPSLQNLSSMNSECISSEAVVHQEEQPINKQNFECLPSSCDNKNFAEEYASVKDIDEDLTIKNLEELKSLVEVDSEESQSQSSNEGIPGSDISCWVDITERDDDFHWKEIPAEKEQLSSSSLQIDEKEPLIEDLISEALQIDLSTSNAYLSCQKVNDIKFGEILNGNDYFANDEILNLNSDKVDTYTGDSICCAKDLEQKDIKDENFQIAETYENGPSKKNNLNNILENLSLTNEVLKNSNVKRISEKEIPCEIDSKLNVRSLSMNHLNKTVANGVQTVKLTENKNGGEDDSKLSYSLPKSFSFLNESVTENFQLNKSYLYESELFPINNILNEECIEMEFAAIDRDEWNGAESHINFPSLVSDAENGSCETRTFEDSKDLIPICLKREKDDLPKPQREEKKHFKLQEPFKLQNMCEASKDSLDNFLKSEEFEKWETEVIPIQECSNSISENIDLLPKPQREVQNNVGKTNTKGEASLCATKINSLSRNTRNVNTNESSNFFKHSSMNLDANWVFPEYIFSPVENFTLPENRVVSVSTVFSQTEPSDLVAIQKIESGEHYTGKYRVLVPSTCEVIPSKDEIKEDNAIVQIAKFEKSTSTDDLIVDVKKTEKINYIQECFPDICEDDLLHFLELCHGNETWLTNLLLDSGYKYNVPHKSDMSETQHVEDVQIPSGAKCISLNLQSTSNLSNVSTENMNSVVSAELQRATPNMEFGFANRNLQYSEADVCLQNINSNCELLEDSDLRNEEGRERRQNLAEINSNTFENLQFVLDPAFAYQLEELFGSVNERNDSECLSPLQRTVQIDMETAKLIYLQWKNGFKTSITRSGSHPVKKRVKSKSRDVTPPTPPQCNEPMSFSEIMDMEHALQLYKKDKLKKDVDFATKLKRQELYNLFPGADTIALDEIFDSNNYSLNDSVKTLSEEWEEKQIFQQKKDSGKIERCVEERNKEDVFKDFENSNWSSWVYDETEVVTPSTISEEALNLRQEATLHFNNRQEYIQKAKDAFHKGMREVSSFYSQKGSEYYQKFKEVNKKASQLIIQQRNDTMSANVLDLHGLYVQEAIPRLNKFLRSWKQMLQHPQCNVPKTVSVITGQGLHSVRGPKLRPSVMEFLKKAGYSFSEVNVGVLDITLDPEE